MTPSPTWASDVAAEIDRVVTGVHDAAADDSDHALEEAARGLWQRRDLTALERATAAAAANAGASTGLGDQCDVAARLFHQLEVLGRLGDDVGIAFDALDDATRVFVVRRLREIPSH